MVTAAHETRASRRAKAKPAGEAGHDDRGHEREDERATPSRRCSTPRPRPGPPRPMHLDQAAHGAQVADRAGRCAGPCRPRWPRAKTTTAGPAVVVVDGQRHRGDGGAPADGDDAGGERLDPVDRLDQAQRRRYRPAVAVGASRASGSAGVAATAASSAGRATGAAVVTSSPGAPSGGESSTICPCRSCVRGS